MKYFVSISKVNNSDQPTQNGTVMLATDQHVEAAKDLIEDVEHV